MSTTVNRRTALGFGTAATAGLVFGTGSGASAANTSDRGAATDTLGPAEHRVGKIYYRASTEAGGTWRARISVNAPDGSALPAVEQGADDQVEAYSVNKVAVAVAVLDKVDRGLLQLNQTVEVSAAIVIPDGDGIFRLDGAYPSTVTIGHALAALLTVSDDTSVRLCGLVCPALEINQILVAKGFPNTQVEPVANPNRFFLGTTTPRETHDLLRALVAGTLLSPPPPRSCWPRSGRRSPTRTASGTTCPPLTGSGWRPRPAGSTVAATRPASCSAPTARPG